MSSGTTQQSVKGYPVVELEVGLQTYVELVVVKKVQTGYADKKADPSNDPAGNPSLIPQKPRSDGKHRDDTQCPYGHADYQNQIQGEHYDSSVSVLAGRESTAI